MIVAFGGPKIEKQTLLEMLLGMPNVSFEIITSSRFKNTKRFEGTTIAKSQFA